MATRDTEATAAHPSTHIHTRARAHTRTITAVHPLSSSGEHTLLPWIGWMLVDGGREAEEAE